VNKEKVGGQIAQRFRGKREGRGLEPKSLENRERKAHEQEIDSKQEGRKGREEGKIEN